MFDCDSSGSLSYAEFNSKIGGLIHEAETGGIGIALQKANESLAKEFMEIRPKNIKSLSDKIAWNNNWRQTLCTPDQWDFESPAMTNLCKQHGYPLIANIVSGKYYAEDHANLPGGKHVNLGEQRRNKGQMWDQRRNKSQMTAMMEYDYFKEAAARDLSRAKVDRKALVRRNKRYTTLLSAGMAEAKRDVETPRRRPLVGLSIGNMSARSVGSAPSSKIGHIPKSSTPRSSYAGRQTPTDSQEINSMMGYPVNEQYAQKTLGWLKSATSKEKEQFKRVASYIKATKGVVTSSRPTTAKSSGISIPIPASTISAQPSSRRKEATPQDAEVAAVFEQQRTDSLRTQTAPVGPSPRNKRIRITTPRDGGGVNTNMLKQMAWQAAART